MKELANRILEISRKKQLSHIGSCLSVLPILIDIYEKKDIRDKVILDNAHAHLAHLVVKEHYEKLLGIEELIHKHGIHCDRYSGCDASGGSLGHGIGIGVGMALVDRSKNVYVIVSDGSLMEGSNWEALRIKENLHLNNLHIYVNCNGYTAVGLVDKAWLADRLRSFSPTINIFYTDNGEGFEGIEGHYKKL